MAIGAAKQAVRLIVVHDLPFLRIPGQGSAQFDARLARMQLEVEMYPCSMSATGLLAPVDRRQEIEHVVADGRGDMPLQVLLGLVLGVLVQLVGHIAMDGWFSAERDEVVAVDAQLSASPCRRRR